MSAPTKEQAVRVLEENPSLDGSIKVYFEAVRDGALPGYYYEEFRRRRFEYSDELPDEDVRLRITDPYARQIQYKCQGNYLLGLTTTLQGAVRDGVIIDRGLQRKIEEFVKSDLNFKLGDPKNAERIQRVNDILDKTLSRLGR